MDKLKKMFGTLVIGLIFMGLILLFYRSCLEPKPTVIRTHTQASNISMKDTVQKYIYRIDTLLKGYKIEVPKVETVYVDKYIPQNPRYFAQEDSNHMQYIIDSLTGKIVDMGKVTRYLNSSKNSLVAGKFTKNSISLDLMNIEGNMVTKNYHVDYNLSDYVYDGEGIRSSHIYHGFIPTTKLESPKALFTTSYLSANYNPFNRMYRAEIEYYIFYGRIGISNRASIDISSKPQPAYRIGLTYRIK